MEVNKVDLSKLFAALAPQNKECFKIRELMGLLLTVAWSFAAAAPEEAVCVSNWALIIDSAGALDGAPAVLIGHLKAAVRKLSLAYIDKVGMFMHLRGFHMMPDMAQALLSAPAWNPDQHKYADLLVKSYSLAVEVENAANSAKLSLDAAPAENCEELRAAVIAARHKLESVLLQSRA